MTNAFPPFNIKRTPEMSSSDTRPHEDSALEYAGDCAGEFLDALGKTDLAKLSVEEWQGLIKCVALNYQNKRIELEPCPF